LFALQAICSDDSAAKQFKNLKKMQLDPTKRTIFELDTTQVDG